ncbi:OmpA family protein [Marinomonas mediterranea]|jgi:Outer membrane protein and related peptidoglycan-associated (lipo)proteins|uniref:OmpA/MotB domain protein n=1 Tax=Marinomonas mediterranea (strain ATCC 700492 / JCM 21426 / NBRC 103028 / MMB-1) TaxID=717774 RepID=F2JZN7_MARM1|nr:OmpA family protein [Marinomonas mediterranea]ADZ90891.1 OmpA/MotB domain protein [Marinomonas mediterranea MMB-1]WCN08938.1 OmpA family protein [Marinomonas mediterranea]WCN12969.1 OmpA family protein [Marinomonas mediterranea]WCN17039.1 OmpA family protein [Marinomonas mediterranea MMB-1]
MFKLSSRHKIATALLLAGFGAAVSAESLYNPNIASRLADGDRDGVIDARDHCANTPAGSRVDNVGCSAESSKLLSVELNILFDSGKDIVKPRYYSEVKKLADFMRKNPQSSIVIEGHTDDVGSEELNLGLSQRRASAIASVLTDSFMVRKSRVKGVGYGETRPIATNDTATGREQNRRVVAEIFARQTADVKRWTIYSVDQNTALLSDR